ncbi:myeloid differentiation primary response protein MyD88 [Anopheles cruzii]|uniref:myeloid differentiation primary response protein MyD88 n=1 Tax=Anopheles cruzii TaxID=68878 RepID=UPI0022EC6E2D|nr:myeloid differentiation primary response protein MyD88 [Anopheles cruzii]
MLNNPAKLTENSVGCRIDLMTIPLEALSPRSRELVAELLNQRRIFTSEDGYFRDWRGAFDVIGLPKSYLALVTANVNPTGYLLDLWTKESDQCKRSAHLGTLQHVLGYIDRWDIVDDTSKLFEQDAEQFLLKEQKQLTKQMKTGSKEQPEADDYDIITKDDTYDHKQQYDAFILYADRDIEFASKMVDRLEGRGMRLCLKDRDLLAGSNCEHELLTRLISERCRRLVVIFSKAFVQSPMNAFVVTYAQALQIEKRVRKVIPCVYEECELPQHLKYTFRLDYTRKQKLFDFWDKLAKSISDPAKATVQDVTQPVLEVDANSLKTLPTISPSAVKVSDEEPTTLIVKMPSTQEMKTIGTKKSHSIWSRLSPFSPRKDKLNRSISQLAVNEVSPSSTTERNPPKGAKKGDQKLSSLIVRSSSSVALAEHEKAASKPKRKWYKSLGHKIATTA